jgi:hypothetical protein
MATVVCCVAFNGASGGSAEAVARLLLDVSRFCWSTDHLSLQPGSRGDKMVVVLSAFVAKNPTTSNLHSGVSQFHRVAALRPAETAKLPMADDE